MPDPIRPAIVREHRDLRPDERATLADHEHLIGQATMSYLVMGRCLREIKERQLYREGYDSWEDYCNKRWDLQKTRSYDLVRSYEVVTALHGRGLPPEDAPRNVEQAIALSRLKEPDAQAEAWRAVLDAHGDRVTGAAVKAEVNRRMLALADSAPQPRPDRVSIVDDREVRGTEPAPRAEDSGIPENEGPRPTDTYDPVEHLRRALPPEKHALLDAQVRLWAAIDPALMEYRREAREAKKDYDREGWPLVGLAREVKGHLTLDAPEGWRLCPSPDSGGCGGQGETPLGPCMKCDGAGFLMRLSRR